MARRACLVRRLRCAGLAVALVAAFALPQAAGQSDAEESSDRPADAGRRPEPPGHTGLPLPRFASLRADEVNLRRGPGLRYPIEWVYRRRHLPVEIIEEFGTWRRIRDWEGTLGWVHQSMLQGRRTARILGEARLLRDGPSEDSEPVARVEPGAIGLIERCAERWCRLDFDNHAGWLRRQTVYGVYPREELE